MQITECFEWAVQIGGNKINSGRQPLSALPQVPTTVLAVKSVLEGIDCFNFCFGNKDKKYISLQAARNGIFKDSTGKLLQLCSNMMVQYFIISIF